MLAPTLLTSDPCLQWLTWHPKANFVVAGNAAGSVMMWSIPAGTMSYFNGHTVSRRETVAKASVLIPVPPLHAD